MILDGNSWNGLIGFRLIQWKPDFSSNCCKGGAGASQRRVDLSLITELRRAQQRQPTA